jgi:probable F420-dependent oxidoreductase
MAHRPFRFAVQSYAAQSPAEWREKARKAEDLGYSAFMLADHYIGPGPALAATNHPVQVLASVPAIAVAAEATSRIRVGCRVFCIDYHHPVVLAKEAATLHWLSGGRLELGLGAGWLEGEYDAMGVRFDPPQVRISRLQEAIALVRAHFSGDCLEHKGEHFSVHGFQGVPQLDAHPPLMIGGGSKRVLQLAAREADIVSLNFNNRTGKIGTEGVRSSTADETARKVSWIREAAGPRLGSIDIEIGAYFTVVTSDPAAAAATLATTLGLEQEEMLQHPHALLGTPDAICDTLLERRERYGINYVTVNDSVMEPFAPVVERLSGR